MSEHHQYCRILRVEVCGLVARWTGAPCLTPAVYSAGIGALVCPDGFTWRGAACCADGAAASAWGAWMAERRGRHTLEAARRAVQRAGYTPAGGVA
jgi:hypothetical protein